MLCLRAIHLFCRYLKVFQYLIRLKRTQMELEKSWASVMHQDHMDFAQNRKHGTNGSISQQRRQGIRPMWRVREHMAFLIRNLQFYIQVKNLRFFLVRVSKLMVSSQFKKEKKKRLRFEFSLCLKVDVIESQWKVLQAHIHDSQDFTELVGFHQE